MVIFKSSDDQLFEVSEAVAIQSEHIKNMIEDVGTANAFPILNISRKIHSKFLEYCKYHVEAHNPVDENSALTTDQATLFQLIHVLCLKPSFNWKFSGYVVFQLEIFWLRSVSVFDFIMVPV